MSAASACAPVSPVQSSRVRARVCSEAASFSAASACVPLSPTEFPRRLRDRVCSEAASFSAASACAPLSPTEFRPADKSTEQDRSRSPGGGQPEKKGKRPGKERPGLSKEEEAAAPNKAGGQSRETKKRNERAQKEATGKARRIKKDGKVPGVGTSGEKGAKIRRGGPGEEEGRRGSDPRGRDGVAAEGRDGGRGGWGEGKSQDAEGETWGTDKGVGEKE